jgi:hypothetical protein
MTDYYGDVSSYFWTLVDMIVSLSFEDLSQRSEFLAFKEVLKKDIGLTIGREELALDVDTAYKIQMQGVTYDSENDRFWFSDTQSMRCAKYTPCWETMGGGI